MEQPDHILVVDDDAEIRRMVADYLRKNGLRATEVADGREMRAALETGAVDLIVLDLMMPGEDGLSLARNLRAGKHKAIPVIMLTARDDATDKIIGLGPIVELSDDMEADLVRIRQMFAPHLGKNRGAV